MKKMFLLALLATGCAESYIWTKDDTTQQDFARDAYSCERDVRQSGYYGGGLAGALEMQAFFDRCMVAHGYKKAVLR